MVMWLRRALEHAQDGAKPIAGTPQEICGSVGGVASAGHGMAAGSVAGVRTCPLSRRMATMSLMTFTP